MITLASQCPNAQVPMDLCQAEPKDVCCKLDTGYQAVPSSQCPTSQVVADELCKDEKVCCKTSAGYQYTLASQCPASQQAAFELCEEQPKDVCCKLGSGYQVVPSTECPQGQVVADEHCEDPCKSTTINSKQCLTAADWEAIATKKCKGAGYVLASHALLNACKGGGYHGVALTCCPDEPKEVCCKTPAGPMVMLSTECNGAILPMSQCDEPCKYGKITDGGACHDMAEWVELGQEKCKTAGLQLTNIHVGKPCKGGGFQAAKIECCEDAPKMVCCETKAGVAFVPEKACKLTQILPDDKCAPCQTQTWGGPSSCKPADVWVAYAEKHCKRLGLNLTAHSFGPQCADGSYQTVTFTCCEEEPPCFPASLGNDGQCLAESDWMEQAQKVCKAQGMVVTQHNLGGQCKGGWRAIKFECCPGSGGCDDAVSGWCPGFNYTAQCNALGGSCAPNAIFSDGNCDGKLDECLVCPAGTAPADLDGDGCEETCDCCSDIKCKPGTVAIDSDGDGCADVCKPIPCEQGTVGWCDGQNPTAYLLQCLAWGGGCGPNAIFADKDCDGKYDVCQQCPPGTHAADLDGDGCQEACDCCEPIKCAKGYEPVDTDKDGCDDECVETITYCDDATFGWCDKQNTASYLKQCLAAGGGCGPDAILADSNCDGQLDVCQLCPAGTHAVDLDGDGCQEACDCCEPIKCPLGTQPVDSDKDGCPDTCAQLPCDEAISGWCDKQNPASYLKQCLAAGGGCGPTGILADENCDGQLDVCIECPEGTHAADLDGDGCEETCDCCKPLNCKVGQTPVDTDKDGCNDTCKGGFADDAASK